MVNVFFRGFLDFANGFLGGRIDGLKGLAILALDELIVDEAVSTWVSLWPRPFGGEGGGETCRWIRVRGKCIDSVQVAATVVCF